MRRHPLRITRTLTCLALVLAGGLAGCGSAPSPVEVTVAVDFGPAARPPLERTIAVAPGSTVFDALRAAFGVATSGR
jgi:hypothetical protein